MRKSMLLATCAAALMMSALAPEVCAYGAAHVGYTHVGPGGVQHYGATEVRGPGGTYAGSHGTAYGAGGGAYHTETRGVSTGGEVYGVHTSTGAVGGYHYAPAYSGAAYGHSTSYGYIR